MTCPRCQTANPDGARFCTNCGSPLAATCPNCGKPVAPGARFCHNCGFALTAAPAAPQAAAATPAAAAAAPAAAAGPASHAQYMPAAFRAKLDAARSGRSMAGERRIVTALFCDVRGSTALAERLDPEEWTEVMNGAFEYLIAPVYRYEGTLARLAGDAIVAFFGAPIAHEDDARRAVLAGLEIVEGARAYSDRVRRERGIEFDVRVGINTGLVVVGEVGSDLHLEYTAMGDAMNVGARMEQTAQPGTVQISANTYRLVESLFDVEDLGDVEVKGKAQPVRAYRALRAREDAAPARGLEGLRSPLVGRDRELQCLRTAADELLAGRGQIVSVMGDAGLGKSRLVAELRDWLLAPPDPAPRSEVSGLKSEVPLASPTSDFRLQTSDRGDRRGGALLWLEGRSFSYESSTPYTPFQRLLGSALGARSAGGEAETYDRIRAHVAAIAPGRVSQIAPFAASLLAVPVTGDEAELVAYLQPPQLRERIFGATRELITRLAETQPLALVFEDLHWADQTSIELLEALLPLTDTAALMVIALFRPLREEPSWRIHELATREYVHRYTPVALEPLGADASRALVANLLHIEDLPESVRALILRKAEGNPFFVEEVIRSLLDSRLVVRENAHWRATRAIENVTVPDTLTGVITARLDRLDEDARRVAQSAAVLGREFRYDVLADVYEPRQALDSALTALQRRELVRELRRLPAREYTFKHVLTQETAYASVLLSRRRDLHRRVAESLERLAPERVNEIARHFLEAREDARALPYLVEAGDRAARAYATAEAISHYRRALQIVETGQTGGDNALARRAYEGLGGVLRMSGDLQGAVETYDAMLRDAEARGDAPMRVSALNKIADAGMYLGQFAELEPRLTESERLAREHDDLAGLAELYTIRCGVCNMAGDFDSAARYLGESIRIGRELGEKAQLAFGLTHTSHTMTYMARFDEAWRIGQEAWQLAEELGDRYRQSELLAETFAFHHLRSGDLDAARRAAEEGTALAARIGAPFVESLGAYMLGALASLRGEHEAAIRAYERALETGHATGFAFLEVMAMCALGTAYLYVSDRLVDKAVALHRQAVELMEGDPTAGVAGGSAWADLGFCAMVVDDLQAANNWFQKGLHAPTIMGLLQRPRYLFGLALIALAENRPDDAAQLVRELDEYVTERGMGHCRPLVGFAAGQVSLARGEPEAAVERFGRAEAAALEMGMRPLVWQARAAAAGALAALGRTSEAEAKRQQARATVEELAALFHDETLRAAFCESAHCKLG